MKTLYLTSLLIVLAVLPGCGTNGTPITPTQPDVTPQQSNRTWNITLSVSGGFAGLQRQLIVDDSGEWRASDRTQGHKTGKLEAEQLARLNDLLTALENAPEQRNMPSFPGRCADCIETRINVTINGKHYATTVLSGHKAAQPYADLLSQLSPLLQATFSKK